MLLRTRSLFVFAAALASACAPTLAGHLVSPGGEPVGGASARVNIAPLAPSLEADAAARRPIVLTVANDGRFATDAALAPGEYLVEALVPGYAIATRRVTIGKDAAAPLALTVSPLGKTRAKATSANLDAAGALGSGGAALTPPNF